jgi:hypothetical protein
MHRFVAAALGGMLGACVLSAASAASAETPLEVFPKQRRTTTVFYGWEILATGEAGGLLSAASILLPERPLSSVPATAGFLVGMPTFALGGPIVHWMHGDFPKGMVSFGGNAVSAVVAGFAGEAIRCGHSDAPDCGELGFFNGLAVAVMLAPLVDAAVLGWEKVPSEDVYGSSTPPRLTLTPTWRLGPRGLLELGLSGQF